MGPGAGGAQAGAAGGTGGSGGENGGGGGEGGAPVTIFDWVSGLGNATDQGTIGSGDASAIGISTAPGHIALGAGLVSSLDLGGGPVGVMGARNLVWARYADDGTHLASGALTGTAVDRAFGTIAVTPSGEMIFAGQFGEGSLAVEGGGELVNTATARDDAFILWFDAAHQIIASRQLRGTQSSTHQRVLSAALTSDGLVVAGQFEGNLVVADASGAVDDDCSLTGDASLSFDAFVARFDASLDCLWASKFGSTGNSANDDVAQAVAVGPGDEIAIGGSFRATMAVGPTMLTASGGEDAFVAHLGPAGAPTWAVGLGRTATDRVRSLAIDGAGEVYFGGFAQGTLAPVGCDEVSTSARDAVVGKLAGADGACVWFRAFGGGGSDEVRAIAAGAGEIAAVGFFAQSIDVGVPTTSNGSEDAFVAMLDATTGATTRGWALGSAGVDTAEGVALRGGALVLSGTYAAAFDVLPPVIQPEDFFFGALSLRAP